MTHTTEYCRILDILTNYWDFRNIETGIAGSFALFCYMTHVLRFTCIEWSPGDCDVFVCCPTEKQFRKTIRRFESRLKKKNVVFVDGGFRHNHYARQNNPLLIKDITVELMNTKISFIHTNQHSTVTEVIKHFDIDVCQVIYYFDRNTFVISNDVKTAIVSGKARVTSDFVFDRNAPTRIELSQLTSTFSRMRKYQERGFTFHNMPFVGSLEHGDVRLMGTSIPMEL